MAPYYFKYSFISLSVQFNYVETCLSAQCSPGYERFIPQKCSESFGKVCENMSTYAINKSLTWLCIIYTV